ncbi:MAG: hypothetical protein WAK93_19025, partial [Solirubrobacteraceae bacterium]
MAELLAGDSLSDVMRELASGRDGVVAELWRARIVQQFRDTYAGIPISKFPEDLRTYEQIIW